MKKSCKWVVLVCLCGCTLPLHAQCERAFLRVLSRQTNPGVLSLSAQHNELTRAVLQQVHNQYQLVNAAKPFLANPAGAVAREGVLPFPPGRTGFVPPPTVTVYTPKQEKTRSWVEQQQRNFKAWQLKRQHAKQVALAQQIAALPKIQPQRTFYTPHLSGLLVQKANLGTVPQAPFIQRPHYLYRGLTLSNDGSSLRNILRNGLLVDDAGAYSNNLLMSLVNTPQDAAAISSMKYTNLSQSPETAMHYAFRDLQQSDDILPVLVSVTGIEETGPVVRVQYDIPAKQLPQVVVLLRLNDELTWCLIELEGDTFKITPYEVK